MPGAVRGSRPGSIREGGRWGLPVQASGGTGVRYARSPRPWGGAPRAGWHGARAGPNPWLSRGRDDGEERRGRPPVGLGWKRAQEGRRGDEDRETGDDGAMGRGEAREASPRQARARAGTRAGAWAPAAATGGQRARRGGTSRWSVPSGGRRGEAGRSRLGRRSGRARKGARARRSRAARGGGARGVAAGAEGQEEGDAGGGRPWRGRRGGERGPRGRRGGG
jgi:hypothetical protein